MSGSADGKHHQIGVDTFGQGNVATSHLIC
jgi:hypothetical protein